MPLAPEDLAEPLYRELTKNSSVYFVRAQRHYIKIGYTRQDVQFRLLELQTGNPQKLELLGVVTPVGRWLEDELHTQFSHLHVRGEWFRAGHELEEYIKKNAQPYVPRHKIVKQKIVPTRLKLSRISL